MRVLNARMRPLRLCVVARNQTSRFRRRWLGGSRSTPKASSPKVTLLTQMRSAFARSYSATFKLGILLAVSLRTFVSAK